MPRFAGPLPLRRPLPELLPSRPALLRVRAMVMQPLRPTEGRWRGRGSPRGSHTVLGLRPHAVYHEGGGVAAPQQGLRKDRNWRIVYYIELYYIIIYYIVYYLYIYIYYYYMKYIIFYVLCVILHIYNIVQYGL